MWYWEYRTHLNYVCWISYCLIKLFLWLLSFKELFYEMVFVCFGIREYFVLFQSQNVIEKMYATPLLLGYGLGIHSYFRFRPLGISLLLQLTWFYTAGTSLWNRDRTILSALACILSDVCSSLPYILGLLITSNIMRITALSPSFPPLRH